MPQDDSEYRAALEAAGQEPPAATEDDETTPWGMIGFGIFMIALGTGLYFLFDHLEQSEEGMRLPAILVLVYEFVGKMWILGICCVIGLLGCWMGISDLIKGK